MRTVIAPVNFTANSVNAARYAADLALAAHADLYLLHVLQVPASPAEFPVSGYVYEALEASRSKALNDLWDELMARTGGKLYIYTHIETGSFEQVLERYCCSKKPWMVVAGASSDSLERVLAGGNLATAIRHLPYPLIVVPAHASFHFLFKVLIACDLEDAAGGLPVNLEFMKSLDQVFHPSFDVLNINTPGQEQHVAEVFNNWKWQESVKEWLPDLHFVSTNTVEEGIAEYLESHPADLLMVFPKKHSFFDFHRSHSKRLALHGGLPVMSIHA